MDEQLKERLEAQRQEVSRDLRARLLASRLRRIVARLRPVRWVLLALCLASPFLTLCAELLCKKLGMPQVFSNGLFVLLVYGSLLAFLVCDLVLRVLRDRLDGKTLAQHLAWCALYLLLYTLYLLLWILYWMLLILSLPFPGLMDIQ